MTTIAYVFMSPAGLTTLLVVGFEPRILKGDTTSDHVVDDDCELAGGCRDRFSLSDSGSLPSIEGAEVRIGFPDGHCSHTEHFSESVC